MKFIIDRFEGEYAVLEMENSVMINVPRAIIPEGAKEGTVLLIEVDNQETDNRKKRISGMMNQLWKE